MGLTQGKECFKTCFPLAFNIDLPYGKKKMIVLHSGVTALKGRLHCNTQDLCFDEYNWDST